MTIISHNNPCVNSRVSVRLDSTLPGANWGWPASTPLLRLRCDPGSWVTTLDDGGRILEQWSDPRLALEWMARFDALPQPGGRWIGYLAYDLGRLFEVLPARAADDLGVPLFVFTYHVREGAGKDELEGGCGERLVGGAGAEGRKLAVGTDGGQCPPYRGLPHSTFSRAAYEAAVRRCIDYIGAGDIFQVNLAQRFSTPLPVAPAEIYRRLLTQNPAWYGGLLDYDDFALISNSPELFLKVTPQADGSRRVMTRPIKGTRPRLAGMEEELRASIKDQAELNMIVDLERNDLGRVCRIGTVRVTQARAVETHPTVFHGVATVEGILRDGVGFVDLLAATFPGGSITGAPKIRAMEIIDELEPTRRGPYCGAIGYLDASGGMEFNIAIRTMVATAGQVHISVGGGIVADSSPAAEYEETLVKAQAMFAALGIAGC